MAPLHFLFAHKGFWRDPPSQPCSLEGFPSYSLLNSHFSCPIPLPSTSPPSCFIYPPSFPSSSSSLVFFCNHWAPCIWKYLDLQCHTLKTLFYVASTPCLRKMPQGMIKMGIRRRKRKVNKICTLGKHNFKTSACLEGISSGPLRNNSSEMKVVHISGNIT